MGGNDTVGLGETVGGNDVVGVAVVGPAVVAHSSYSFHGIDAQHSSTVF